MTENTNVLTTLAILKTNADSAAKIDYIDSLKPFVLHLLPRVKNTISPENLQPLIETTFGLSIPMFAISAVLRRLTKEGLLAREHSLYRFLKEPPTTNIETQQEQTKIYQQQVLQELQHFAQNKYALDLNEDKARELIIRYLSSFSIACLQAKLKGSPLPALTGKADKKELYVVNAFIADAINNQTSAQEGIMILVKGHMLANALICSDLDNIEQNYKHVTFYFDSAILFSLLEIQDEHLKPARLELLKIIKNLKGTLAVFEHTIEEMKHVLKWTKKNFANEKLSNKILEHMRQSGRTPSDIDLLMSQLERRLASFNIVVRAKPSYHANMQYQVSETELIDLLKREQIYSREETLSHDVECIRSIYALRRNKISKKLESSTAIFVTSNLALAKVASSYARQETDGDEISSVITDFVLANLTWIKCPLETKLPEFEIISACYFAMHPKEDLWEKFLLEVEKLQQDGFIAPDDVVALRYSEKAKYELMEVTLGAEENITPTNIKSIIERVKSDYTKEKETEIGRINKEKIAIAEERDNLRKSQDSARDSIFSFAKTTGHVCSMVFQLVGIALLVAAMYYLTFKIELLASRHASLKIAVALILSIGINIEWIEKWALRCSETLVLKLNNFLLKRFQLDQ